MLNGNRSSRTAAPCTSPPPIPRVVTELVPLSWTKFNANAPAATPRNRKRYCFENPTNPPQKESRHSECVRLASSTPALRKSAINLAEEFRHRQPPVTIFTPCPLRGNRPGCQPLPKSLRETKLHRHPKRNRNSDINLQIPRTHPKRKAGIMRAVGSLQVFDCRPLP